MDKLDDPLQQWLVLYTNGTLLLDNRRKGCKKHTQLLKVYGMNSITAYMLTIVVSFSSISQSLFHGLEQYVGDYYHFIIALSNCTIIYLILRYMYKHQVYLKV